MREPEFGSGPSWLDPVLGKVLKRCLVIGTELVEFRPAIAVKTDNRTWSPKMFLQISFLARATNVAIHCPETAALLRQPAHAIMMPLSAIIIPMAKNPASGPIRPPPPAAISQENRANNEEMQEISEAPQPQGKPPPAKRNRDKRVIRIPGNCRNTLRKPAYPQGSKGVAPKRQKCLENYV